MKKMKKMKNKLGLILKSKWCNPVLGIAMISGLFFSNTGFASEILKEAMPALKENFGTGSIAIKMIYLAEILSAAFIYIKTKDYRIAGSILLVAIYLTYTLGNLVFQGT